MTRTEKRHSLNNFITSDLLTISREDLFLIKRVLQQSRNLLCAEEQCGYNKLAASGQVRSANLCKRHRQCALLLTRLDAILEGRI